MLIIKQILDYLAKGGEWYTSIILASLVLILGILAILILSRMSRISLNAIASRTQNTTDDFIIKVLISSIKPIGLICVFSMAWIVLPLNESLDNIVLGVNKFIILVLIVRIINKILIRLIRNWSTKVDDTAIATMIESFSPMIRAIVWTIASVFYLQNMGVQMAAVWALLSAGGIGAGLALKEPVQEFFEYITILLDKPFQKGQFINVQNVWASVESVGVRSTRLRSLHGEIIVMSNSALTKSTISNYAQMNRRRISHKIGVVYDTDHLTMIKIPQLLEGIINSTEDAEFDRAHFTDFGDYSLNFEFVYYVPTNNYKRAMNAQQKINLSIMQSFEKNNIEFAFPTKTVHLIEDKV